LQEEVEAEESVDAMKIADKKIQDLRLSRKNSLKLKKYIKKALRTLQSRLQLQSLLMGR